MPLLMKNVSIHGIATGHRRALEDLVRALDRTSAKPVVDSRFALSDLSLALDRAGRRAVWQGRDRDGSAGRKRR
jgi:NADPH:quinone reductase-like Zn-dependent oxidoreductase